jgi:hypothetical protein
MITNSVIRVGDGRGFVVEDSRGFRYVITAAHCLPFFPPCHGFSDTHEGTYENLLARLGEQPSVWCECVFVDPIADIAVLSAPDNQELAEQAEAYEALVEDDAITPFTIAEPPSKPIAEQVASLTGIGVGEEEAMRECGACLLSLEGEWFPCKVRHYPNGMLMIHDAAPGIMGGMSGSPIITEGGKAIGIVCIGSEVHPEDDGTERLDRPTEGGPNPRLMGNLPGWFLKKLSAHESGA